jgi:hypothetical protein
MTDIDLIAQLMNLVDGISAVALAVWVINLLSRQQGEERKQSESLIERVLENNKELMGLVRDLTHAPRNYPLPTTQPRPIEFEKNAGL